MKKWTKEQIELLIDAFKRELCLYACNLPAYHNKHLRREALERVFLKDSKIRANSSADECQKKIKYLRNQFNIENSKVKQSLKCGIGTGNVYKPSLWYFNSLQFLQTYATPRKSRNSIEPSVQLQESQSLSIATECISSKMEYSEQVDYDVTTLTEVDDTPSSPDEQETPAKRRKRNKRDFDSEAAFEVLEKLTDTLKVPLPEPTEQYKYIIPEYLVSLLKSITNVELQ